MGQHSFSQGATRPSGLGPMTNCPVVRALEPVSGARVEVVPRDCSILQLVLEDSDATLPYNPKQQSSDTSGLLEAKGPCVSMRLI